jgi:glycosyltransferase involved in cell wall biosynthesis
VRVLVITNMYPPHHLGGYELSCRDTVERFRRRGHEVSVLTTTLRFDTAEAAAGDEEHGVHRDLELYWRDHEIVRPPLRERLRIERHNQAVLRARLTEDEPEVVSCWNMGAMSMGLLTTVVEADLPSVLVVCDDWLVYAPRVDPWARRFRHAGPLAGLARRVTGVPTALVDLGRVGAVCFVSESVRRTAADHTRWSFPRWAVTYSGIDRGDFPPAAPDEQAGAWAGRLLYVGRVEARKGIETAIRALAELPASHRLTVLGPVHPRYRADLDRLAGGLGVSDRIELNEVPRPALRDRYLAADAVLFPSEWAEPFGLVPLEAMACGRPVVATGTGGSAEFLRDGWNCLRFRAGDPADLAAAVGRLAADPDLRARLVANGLTTAAELDTDALADALEGWHVAAGRRFADGVPPARRRLGSPPP